MKLGASKARMIDIHTLSDVGEQKAPDTSRPFCSDFRALVALNMFYNCLIDENSYDVYRNREQQELKAHWEPPEQMDRFE